MTPEDLSHHNCLLSRGATLNASWPVVRNGSIGNVRVTGSLIANNGYVMRDAALAGIGVIMTAHWIVADDLASARLVEVLPEHAPENRAVYAVLPRQGALMPKVRAYVDFLKECCAELH